MNRIMPLIVLVCLATGCANSYLRGYADMTTLLEDAEKSLKRTMTRRESYLAGAVSALKVHLAMEIAKQQMEKLKQVVDSARSERKKDEVKEVFDDWERERDAAERETKAQSQPKIDELLQVPVEELVPKKQEPCAAEEAIIADPETADEVRELAYRDLERCRTRIQERALDNIGRRRL